MEIPMEVITCCYTSCGLTFCVPAGWVRLRQADHKSWCCPNGHIQSFTGKTEADGLRERLAASENEISAKLKTEPTHTTMRSMRLKVMGLKPR